jgi:hypothetical protein
MSNIRHHPASQPIPTGSVTQGWLVAIDHQGVAWIESAQTPPGKPVPAQSMLQFPASARAFISLPAKVLLSLIDNDPHQPVILGLLHPHFLQHADTSADYDNPQDQNHINHRPVAEMQQIDARYIRIEGRDEIQLSCGDSSIALKKDGQVIIKGDRISTRARRLNRIKGANVRIN